MQTAKLETKEISVLYVDDEESNLDAFTANFRKHFKVFTADSAKKGKELLKQNDIHVIVSDQKMPEVTGVEFLESVYKENPDPVRIILTGYSDPDTIIDAINKGQVYRYLMKPFEKQELQEVIEGAFDIYSSKKSLEKIKVTCDHLFNTTNDVVFEIDTDGNLIKLNKFGQTLFKIPDNKISSTKLLSLFNDFDDYLEIHSRLNQNKPILDLSVRLINSHGVAIDSFISLYPLINQTVTYKGVIRDITKIKDQERLLLRSVIEDLESEKFALTHELRESICQELCNVKLRIELMLQKADDENYPVDELKESKDELSKLINSINDICNNIIPASYKWLGVVPAIRELCRNAILPSGLDFKLNVGDDFPRINSRIEVAIFRIVQEFIQNTQQHAKATKLVIALAHEPMHIYLLMKDNGVGFDPNTVKNGNGLKTVYSRVHSYNGEIRIQSGKGGTEFHIMLPLVKALTKSELN